MGFYTTEDNRGYTSLRIGRIAATALLGVTTIIGGLTSCTTVPAGHVGVRHRFGNVQEESFKSGFHIKSPIESVVDLSVRTLEVTESMTVPTSEGLTAKLDVSALYHLEGTKVSDIYQSVGTTEQFSETIIKPNLRSVTRDVVANYKGEDLYSGKREAIAGDIKDILTDSYAKRGAILESILIRDLQLPQRLTDAIESKMQAEQEAQRMQFVLLQETQEAERKTIEAGGIADAQAIISKSLDQPYLQWKYIESLQGLIESDTNTVIVMPYDQALTPMLNIK